MLLKSRFSRAATACGLIFALSVFTFADTIRLKDGSVIKGKIVSFGGGKFVVVVGEGTTRRRELNYSASEVESISFDSNSAAAETSNVGANVGQQQQTSGERQTSAPQINSNAAANANANRSANQNPPVAATSAATIIDVPPITLNIKVLADNTSNGWTDSKFVVQKGQRIRISAAGQISLGNGNYAAPKGIASLSDAGKLVPQGATGGLIAVIGDDNNEFIFVGSEREFVATRDGALFLGVNEGNLNDNSGRFDVKIEIQPN